jgi:hypothetical protein
MNDTPILVVECQASDKTRYFRERDSDRCNWNNTVADIRSGDLEKVHAVYEIGRSVPVTEDIARDVLASEINENLGSVSPHLIDFLEEHLGCLAVAQAQREFAA